MHRRGPARRLSRILGEIQRPQPVPAPPQPLPEELHVAVDEMPRPRVAPVDQRVMALDQLPRAIRQRRQMRVMHQQRRAQRPHVDLHPGPQRPLQLPHRLRQHHHIAGRLGRFEDHAPHVAGLLLMRIVCRIRARCVSGLTSTPFGFARDSPIQTDRALRLSRETSKSGNQRKRALHG